LLAASPRHRRKLRVPQLRGLGVQRALQARVHPSRVPIPPRAVPAEHGGLAPPVPEAGHTRHLRGLGMRRRLRAPRGLAPTTLALAAAVSLATCLASSDSRSAPVPDAPDAASEPKQACTLLGCADGLLVTLESGSAWPNGTYRFEVQADDVQVTCRGS